jgi:hypothetical protein
MYTPVLHEDKHFMFWEYLSVIFDIQKIHQLNCGNSIGLTPYSFDSKNPEDSNKRVLM